MFFSKKKKNEEDEIGLGSDVDLEELFGDEDEKEDLPSNDLLFENDTPEPDLSSNTESDKLEDTKKDINKEEVLSKDTLTENENVKTEDLLIKKEKRKPLTSPLPSMKKKAEKMSMSEKIDINDIVDAEVDIKSDPIVEEVENEAKKVLNNEEEVQEEKVIDHFEEKVTKRSSFKERLSQKIKEPHIDLGARDHSRINNMIDNIKDEVKKKKVEEMKEEAHAEVKEVVKKEKKPLFKSLKEKISKKGGVVEEEESELEKKQLEVMDKDDPVLDISNKEVIKNKVLKVGKVKTEDKSKKKKVVIKKEEKINKKEEVIKIEKKEEVLKAGNLLKFPEGFLWGTSTSAYQVEGGIKCDWSKWEKSKKRSEELKKKNLNSSQYICGDACDSRNRYKEDLDLSVELNNNAVRFGLEWARLMPDKNTVNVGEINYYRDKMEEARKRGLKIVVTLWHWTNPVWISENGGWANKETVEHFKDYVDLVMKEFGAYIDYWVTLNEPMIHVFNGYVSGKFPPAKKFRLLKANRVFKNLVQAHKNSYEMIHGHFMNSKVSITKITNFFEPAHKWCLLDVLIAKVLKFNWNSRFLNSIENHIDYIGLDYYFHDRVVCYPPFIKNKNEKVNDMGWEIYPKGIYNVLKYLEQYKKPIIIIENGIADKDDKYRADFIRDHLRYVHQAISEGIDVRGYFHWSLLDNFEWAHGYEPKFGLYEVNFKTKERKARPSAQVYAEICKNNGVEV